MKKYSEKQESEMILYYNSLGERSRRQYAYLESTQLGHGGKRYIGELLGISYKTIRKGGVELSNPSQFTTLEVGRQRKAGGGRKKF